MKTLFTLLGIFFALSIHAQRTCGTMDHLEHQKELDPNLEQRMEAIERFTHDIEVGTRAVDGVITIPVVVHVVWNTAAENISDAQIQSQMDVLNEDFRRLNQDADNVWSQAADTEFEFCLASIDPEGNPTSGITRTQTSQGSFSAFNDNVKFSSSGGKDAWPASDYLNIWVCDISFGILGYAQFPGGNPATDGVVNDYLYFGTIGTATAPFDLGRTCTHEVGHYLNLRHIWGDGGCSVDDFVGDTPTSNGANYNCQIGSSSCGSVDMVQNYMDYSDDACMNLFTQGQTGRMRALFEPGGFRASLLTSNACGGQSSECQAPTDLDVIEIDFGGSNPRVNATWSNPEGTTSCEVRGGRISNASAGTANPVFGNINNTQVITATDGSTLNFNIQLVNNPNIPFQAGATYGYEVRCACADGTGFSPWSGIFPSSTFDVPGTGARTKSFDESPISDIYPNPTERILNVVLKSDKDSDIQLIIRDLSGRVVFNQSLSGLADDQLEQMDVSDYPSGIYFLESIQDGHRNVHRFVIR
jgi:hypothetical protein